MKPGKKFDCVEMKAEIQERLQREVAELGEEEAQKRRGERLSRDSILGNFLRSKTSGGSDSEVWQAPGLRRAPSPPARRRAEGPPQGAALPPLSQAIRYRTSETGH